MESTMDVFGVDKTGNAAKTKTFNRSWIAIKNWRLLMLILGACLLAVGLTVCYKYLYTWKGHIFVIGLVIFGTGLVLVLKSIL